MRRLVGGATVVDGIVVVVVPVGTPAASPTGIGGIAGEASPALAQNASVESMNRLSGATRASSRYLSSAASGSTLKLTTLAPSTRAATPSLAPPQTNTGRPRAPSRSMSLSRADRMGPTGADGVEWKMAIRRVMPSTRSSMTMSATSRPTWGRASGEFETLTAIAGRSTGAPSGAGRPVSGHTVTGTVVVGTAASVVGGGASSPRVTAKRTPPSTGMAMPSAIRALRRGSTVAGGGSAQSSRSAAMRSSSGGWVSKRLLRRAKEPSSFLRAIGCSIQR